jgi:CBS domain-containing protein
LQAVFTQHAEQGCGKRRQPGRKTMKINEVMTRRVEVVHPDATIEEAAEKMKSLDVGALPVCDGDRLQGMITDRDITVRATAEGYVPGFTKVRTVMTEDVQWCFDDEDVQAAAEIMQRAQIRRLPIVNREKRLVGIVSLGDVAVRTDDEQLSGEILEDVSEPAASQA